MKYLCNHQRRPDCIVLVSYQVSAVLVVLVSVGSVRRRSAPVERRRRWRSRNWSSENVLARLLLLPVVHQLMVGRGPATVGNVGHAATGRGESVGRSRKSRFLRQRICRIRSQGAAPTSDGRRRRVGRWSASRRRRWVDPGSKEFGVTLKVKKTASQFSSPSHQKKHSRQLNWGALIINYRQS